MYIILWGLPVVIRVCEGQLYGDMWHLNIILMLIIINNDKYYHYYNILAIE